MGLGGHGDTRIGDRDVQAPEVLDMRGHGFFNA